MHANTNTSLFLIAFSFASMSDLLQLLLRAAGMDRGLEQATPTSGRRLAPGWARKHDDWVSR